MKTDFISRHEAIRQIETGLIYETDLISISDTNSEKAAIRQLWLAHKPNDAAAIFLNFADLEDNNGFSEHKARQIVRFVKQSYQKRADVRVHCYAGVSRSGAVSKFIDAYFMLGDTYLEEYQGHNHHHKTAGCPH